MVGREIVVDVIRGELHSVLKPVGISVVNDGITGIPVESRDVYGVSVLFAVDEERVVFRGIPHVVAGCQDFDPQSVRCGGCHLVHSFQADPEFSTWNAESVLIAGPGKVKIGGIVDLLVDGDPAVDGIHRSRLWERRYGEVHQFVLS